MHVIFKREAISWWETELDPAIRKQLIRDTIEKEFDDYF